MKVEKEKQIKERYDVGKVYYDDIINELKSK